MNENKISALKINVDNGLLEQINLDITDVYLTANKYQDDESETCLIHEKKTYRLLSVDEIDIDGKLFKMGKFFSDSD